MMEKHPLTGQCLPTASPALSTVDIGLHVEAAFALREQLEIRYQLACQRALCLERMWHAQLLQYVSTTFGVSLCQGGTVDQGAEPHVPLTSSSSMGPRQCCSEGASTMYQPTSSMPSSAPDTWQGVETIALMSDTLGSASPSATCMSPSHVCASGSDINARGESSDILSLPDIGQPML